MSVALVWTEPVERGDLKLAKDDIPEAVDWFTENTGQAPGLIMLCPKNERFAPEIPEGIDVIYSGGILLWEVLLSADKQWGPRGRSNQNLGAFEPEKVSGDGQTILATVKPEKIRVAKIKSRPPIVSLAKKKELRGRKKLKLPERKILAMAKAGMGSKQISNKLKDKYGVEVAFRTIARFLAEKRQGRLIFS